MGQNLFRQSAWIYVLTYFAAIGGYLMRVLLTKHFSPEEFGLFYAVLGLLTLVSVFNDLGLSETLNYFGVKWHEEKKFAQLKFLIYLAVIFQFVTALIIGVVLFVTREFLLTSFFKVSLQYETFFVIMIVYFISYNLIFTLNALTNVLGRYEVPRMKETIVKIILVSGIFFIIPLSQTLETLALIWGISFLIGVIILAWFVIPQFLFLTKVKMAYGKSLLKKILGYSTQVVIGSSAIILMTKLDVLFITLFLNVSAVGYYEVGFALATIMLFIIAPMTSIMFPITTKYIERGEREKLNQLVQLIYRFYLIVAAFMVISFFLFSKEIILLMFGETYLIATIPFLILSCAVFFQIFSGLHNVILGGLGKVRERNKSLYIAAGLNIVLNLSLITALGVPGVAIATFVTFMTLAFLTFRTIRKNGITPFVYSSDIQKQLKWGVLGIVLFIVATLSLKIVLTPLVFLDALFWNSLLKTVIVAIIGTSLYFGTLWYGRVFRLYPIGKHFGKQAEKYIPKWL